jgi:hypothetical protein
MLAGLTVAIQLISDQTRGRKCKVSSYAADVTYSVIIFHRTHELTRERIK